MINTEILSEKMIAKNLTQEALADLIGVTQPMCSPFKEL
jgi:predicted transcriptional regulator